VTAATALSWLLAASWKATLVIGLILAVRAVSTGWLPPAWRSALWAVAAARLLLPVGPASGLSLFGLLAGAGGGRGLLLPGLGDLSAASGGLGAAAAGGQTGGLGVAGWALSLWAIGVLGMAGRAVAAHRRRRALLAAARPIADPALPALVADCRRALGLRAPVEVRESGDVATPALAGRLVLLPSGLLARLDEREMRHVLLHELAHLRRRDAFALRLGRALVALHWFNPVVHVAFRMFRSDTEVAADALALARLGSGESAGYGRTLLAFAVRQRHFAALPGLLSMSSTRRQLHRRITMIARFRPATRRRLPALFALVAGLALVALTDVGGLGASTAASASAAGAPATAEDAEQSRVTIDRLRTAGVALFKWYGDRIKADGAATPQPAPAPDRFDWSRCPRVSADKLTALLVPKYVAELPKSDGWGHPLEFCLRVDGAAAQYAIGVRSPGRDGRFAGDLYATGPFPADAVDHDYVWMDGYFIAWPERQEPAGD
jgi:beta-lactamase regulating signal transducer with metallopeptidase domain